MGITAVPILVLLLYTSTFANCQSSPGSCSVCNCQLNNVESLRQLVETVVNETVDSKLQAVQRQVNASIDEKIDINQQYVPGNLYNSTMHSGLPVDSGKSPKLT